MDVNKHYPIRKNKRFINPHTPNIHRKFFHVLLWQMGYYNDKIPLTVIPEEFEYPNPKIVVKKEEPKVTWLGHCTFLIEIHGVHILTDPVWSRRCSPVSFLGPKRRHDPPIPLDLLPTIDFVLVSHNHYDHLDKKTVLTLQRKSPHITWVIPEGLRKLFARWGILKVVELSWWENIKMNFFNYVSFEINITAVPAQHFSGRKGWDLNKTLWGGFVFELKRKGKEPKSFYFVGDTGYNPHDFKAIGKHFDGFDLSLIPIGTYIPRRFMSPVHIEPKNSVNIHSEVKSKLSLGMHWKTFRLSSEPMHQPPFDLHREMEKRNLDPLTFRVTQPGQVINW